MNIFLGRYPFVSSEILGSEISDLMRAFFEDARETESFISASASKNFDHDHELSENEENKELRESGSLDKSLRDSLKESSHKDKDDS